MDITKGISLTLISILQIMQEHCVFTVHKSRLVANYLKHSTAGSREHIKKQDCGYSFQNTVGYVSGFACQNMVGSGSGLNRHFF